VITHNLQRLGAEFGVLRECFDLQRQALADIARADAGGLQALQVLQRNAQIFGVDFQFFR
jgi:hypothetical protein